MEELQCPIWGTPARHTSPGGGDYRDIDSARAGGSYRITGTVVAALQSLDDRKRASLTTWLADQRRLGAERPVITSSTLTDASSRRALTIQERCDRGLLYIASQIHTIDRGIVIADGANRDAQRLQFELCAATEATTHKEWAPILRFLAGFGWIELHQNSSVTLTFKGLEHLETLHGRQSSATQAFVAMWFALEMQAAYEEGIAPAIQDAGYQPIRIDQKEHNQKIDDMIIAEIRRSRFVVADFTAPAGNPRGGVYFEAGFAQGLGIPVIWSCRADRISEVHFDTRQFNHILWDDPVELRKKLAVRVAAVIGDGPLLGRR